MRSLRIIIGLIVIFILAFNTIALAGTTFVDIEGTRYEEAIIVLEELGIMDGMPNNQFYPENEVTRAQVAKILTICMGLEDSAQISEGITGFSDVSSNHWASGYINIMASKLKCLPGYEDGTFKPEQNITYAELVSATIRCLGYGPVVDSKDTYPNNYMLKAVELELLDNMQSPKAAQEATRGNMAILIWNMLRTPMWKITSENEGTGMTSKADALMLNVKFPNYLYAEDAYLNAVEIDEGEVTVKLVDEDEKEVATGVVTDVDLPRLVLGMKFSVLIKDYEDSENAKFIMNIPEYSVVEGLITGITETKIEIDGVEYRINGANVNIDDYIVAEVDGKKITLYNNTPVIKFLSTAAEKVEKINTIEDKISDNTLVIIDGEWTNREDIEIGDVYTEINDFNNMEVYYMVTRERRKGNFESLTMENEEVSKALTVEVDGKKYRALSDQLTIFERTENDIEVQEAELRNDAEKNKFLAQEVEILFNYLGQAIEMNFGEIPELETNEEVTSVSLDISQNIQKLYNAKEYEVFPFEFDAEKMNISGNKATNAGIYKLELALKDKEKYAWNIYNKETQTYFSTTDNQLIEWEIKKVNWECEITNKNQNEEQVKLLQYTIIPNVTTGSVSISYCEENDTEYTTILPTEAGTYQVQIEVKDDQNLIDGIYEDTLVIVKNSNIDNSSNESEGLPVEKTYTTRIRQTTGGNIVTESSKVKEGEDQKFEIIPEEGYEIVDVKVDGESMGAISTYVLKNVQEVHSITAIFEKISKVENNVEEQEDKSQNENTLDFEDIKEDDWYYKAVDFVTKQGLFKGVSETQFGAKVKMNRAMIVTVLYRHSKAEITDTANFDDVNENAYYSSPIAWAAKNEIVNGVGANLFAPDTEVTREQLVVILYRYAKYMNQDVSVGENTNILSYDDFNQISEYSISAFQWACGNEIISGKTETTLAPKDTASRAEVATILMRFSEKINK